MTPGEIEVTRNGSRLVLSFLLPGETTKAELGWECGSEWAARLLCDWLGEEMRARLKNIREDAYNFGWKQAKAKKGGKNEWWPGNWQWRWNK